MAAEVKPLQPVRLPTGPAAITPDQRYWNSFASQLLLPSANSSPITQITAPSVSLITTSLSGSATNPSDLFAITTGPRIQLLSSTTRAVSKTIARTTSTTPGSGTTYDTFHTANLRRDGRLLLAGSASGTIQAFDTSSRAILKTWKEHKQPVWVAKWSPQNLTGCMSGSDDATVRLWDLPADKSSWTGVGHTDYVRSGAFLGDNGAQSAGGIFVSGSYDRTVKIWDPRVRPGEAASGDAASRTGSVMTFGFKSPVETVLPMPSGTTVLAASGAKVAVLDLVAGKPLHLLRNHQKTVTSLALATNGTRVLSGALDGHVKAFETSEWNVVAGFKYPSPVLALSVVAAGRSREDKHLVVGMQSGLLSIKTRLSGAQKAAAKEKEKEMQALVEGKIEDYDRKNLKRKRKQGQAVQRARRGLDYTGEGADIVIDGNPRRKKAKESQWQMALRKAQYGKALDLVLDPDTYSTPRTLTLLTALRHRSALRAALSDRDERTLQPILKWLVRGIQDPRHVRLAADVAFVVLDLYAAHMGASSAVDGLVERLHDAVRKGAEVAQQCWAAGGMLDVVAAGGS